MSTHNSTLTLGRKRMISVGLSLLTVLGHLWLVPANATSTFKAFRVLGQVDFSSNSAGSIRQPRGITIDPSGRILVADTAQNRVLIWNSLPAVNNSPPDYVLGQADLVSTAQNRGGPIGAGTMRCPTGISVSWDGRILVSDYGNNRVLIWNSFWNAPTNGASADVVVGQPNFTSGPGGTGCDSPVGPASASSLAHPGGASIAPSTNRLFVADTYNSRVLVWFTVPSSNGAPADLVLGQSDLGASAANRGTTPTGSTLNLPFAVDSDGTRLFVADSLNNRVLLWNRLPAPGDPNGFAADLVLGQPDMTGNTPNRDYLTWPSARTFNTPVSLEIYGGMLAVSEHFNHRVLLYHKVPTSNFAPASDEIGHGRFTSASPGTPPTDTGLNHPWGVALSANGIVVSDAENNRVVAFPTPLPASGNVTAVADNSLQITVSWSAISGASGYRIFRDGFWYGDVNAPQLSFTDGNLSPDAYRYSISALSDQNRVEGSSMGSASATAAGTLPGLVVTRRSSYRFYLAEGDSVASEDNAYANRPAHMYPQQISNYLPAPYYNGARSGSTCVTHGTQSILEPNRLPQEIANYNPDLVTIGIGLNDSIQGYQGTHGKYGMAEYASCMRRVIQTVQPGPNRTLLLLNFHHMTNWAMNSPRMGGLGNAPDEAITAGSEDKKRAWNKVVRDVAAHAGVPVVDVTKAMDTALAGSPSKTYLLPSDKVHPDQDGQDVIAEAAVDQLLNFLPVSGGPPHPGRPFSASESVTTDQSSLDVEFSWTPTSGSIRSEDGYQVRWSQDPSFGSFQSTSTSVTQTTVNLTNGKWFVKVRAFSPSGVAGPWSLNGRVKISAPTVGDPPPSATSPSKPGRPSASYSGGNLQDFSRRWLRIQWEKSMDPDAITHSEVRWCRKPGTEGVGYNLAYQCKTDIAWGDTNYYDMMEVLPAGVWEFDVRSIDTTGEKSVWSDKGTWVSPMLY